MAYYLSKNNRIFINSILKKLEENNDIELHTDSPKTLADILRNAGATEEFKWIKSKYTLRVRERSVYCKLRIPTIIEAEDRNIEPVEKVDFFTIANNLILNKPDKVSYPVLTNKSDLTKLELWCLNNNYTFENDNINITFIKNNND